MDIRMDMRPIELRLNLDARPGFTSRAANPGAGAGASGREARPRAAEAQGLPQAAGHERA